MIFKQRSAEDLSFSICLLRDAAQIIKRDDFNTFASNRKAFIQVLKA